MLFKELKQGASSRDLCVFLCVNKQAVDGLSGKKQVRRREKDALQIVMKQLLQSGRKAGESLLKRNKV